jgi:hypothetical protein
MPKATGKKTPEPVRFTYKAPTDGRFARAATAPQQHLREITSFIAEDKTLREWGTDSLQLTCLLDMLSDAVRPAGVPSWKEVSGVKDAWQGMLKGCAHYAVRTFAEYEQSPLGPRCWQFAARFMAGINMHQANAAEFRFGMPSNEGFSILHILLPFVQKFVRYIAGSDYSGQVWDKLPTLEREEFLTTGSWSRANADVLAEAASFVGNRTTSSRQAEPAATAAPSERSSAEVAGSPGAGLAPSAASAPSGAAAAARDAGRPQPADITPSGYKLLRKGGALNEQLFAIQRLVLFPRGDDRVSKFRALLESFASPARKGDRWKPAVFNTAVALLESADVIPLGSIEPMDESLDEDVPEPAPVKAASPGKSKVVVSKRTKVEAINVGECYVTAKPSELGAACGFLGAGPVHLEEVRYKRALIGTQETEIDVPAGLTAQGLGAASTQFGPLSEWRTLPAQGATYALSSAPVGTSGTRAIATYASLGVLIRNLDSELTFLTGLKNGKVELHAGNQLPVNIDPKRWAAIQANLGYLRDLLTLLRMVESGTLKLGELFLNDGEVMRYAMRCILRFNCMSAAFPHPGHGPGATPEELLDNVVLGQDAMATMSWQAMLAPSPEAPHLPRAVPFMVDEKRQFPFFLPELLPEVEEGEAGDVGAELARMRAAIKHLTDRLNELSNRHGNLARDVRQLPGSRAPAQAATGAADAPVEERGAGATRGGRGGGGGDRGTGRKRARGRGPRAGAQHKAKKAKGAEHADDE